MVRAIWNGAVVAESDDTLIVDGNHYFPRDSVRDEFLKDSTTTSVCGWKGTATYHTLVVEGKENPDAAWTYRDPKEKAKNITGRVAFWKGVQVE